MWALAKVMDVAVIPDTHGLLRPEVVEQLQSCDHIIHAGDIGSFEVVEQLQELAPLSMVRGNVDTAAWALAIPQTDFFQLDAIMMYCLLDLQQLDLDPVAAELKLVITGHAHQPALFEKDGVMYLNPGSIGPRRFSLPISMAKIKLQDDQLDVTFIEL